MAPAKGPPFPPWFTEVVEKRALCRSASLTLYGVLRKRWRVMRDVATMLARLVWDSRRHPKWEMIGKREPGERGVFMHEDLDDLIRELTSPAPKGVPGVASL